jgi:hypothetical protein
MHSSNSSFPLSFTLPLFIVETKAVMAMDPAVNRNIGSLQCCKHFQDERRTVKAQDRFC